MAEFCHRTPLARESVTKVRPPYRPPSPREGECCGPKCRPKPWLEPRPYASSEGLQMFTQRDHFMSIIAKPATGSKRPVPADRQRPLEGPAPANPDTFPGQHRERLHLAACPEARGADPPVLDEGFCHRDPLARKAVTKRGPLPPAISSAIAGVAGRKAGARLGRTLTLYPAGGAAGKSPTL